MPMPRVDCGIYFSCRDGASTGSRSDWVAIPAITTLAIRCDPVAAAPGTDDLNAKVGTPTLHAITRLRPGVAGD